MNDFFDDTKDNSKVSFFDYILGTIGIVFIITVIYYAGIWSVPIFITLYLI